MESDSVGWELLIILLLIIGNGVCSLAEIAIVGVRKNRLHQMVKEGKRGAKQALALAERKEELFSTIQVGITSISIVTGMFSGAALAKPLADILKDIPQVGTYLAPLSMVIVMALVTYVTLIVGELAPKWIAIAMPEKAACWVATPMVLFSTVCKPLVMFSTWSTKVVVGLLGVKMGHEAPVSEEEIRVMLIEGAKSGTIDKEEPELINRIFQLNDITAADRMTPRTQLVWIDLADTEENIWKEINESSHFRLPVGDGSLDNFKGLVDMSDILLDQHTYPDKPIKASIMDTVYKPLYIPETITLTRVLSAFKTAGVHEAVVIDEYGTLSGLITLHDWLEEIVGDMPGDTEDVVEKRNKIIRQSEHAWLVDGALTIDDFREYFHIEEELPGEAESYYKTVAGFITYRLGYIPKETEKVTYEKYTFEVVDCDNRRIDKVLVTEETFREGENDEKGKTPEDLLAKIKKELQEDRAFLQIALLDPDPDIRVAEEARVQNVLQLAEMMEDIIKEILSPEFISDEKVLENADEEIQKFKATIGEKTEEIGKACEEYTEDVTNDRNETEDQGKKEHNIYVEYGTHTLGQSENRENIEGDWILNADGEEENEEKKEKKSKKKGKKDKKNKKDKKKKKDKKNKK